jgi:hypothetical protein
MSGEKLVTIKYAFGSLLLSVFVAMVLDFVAKELKLSQNLWAVAMCMGGYCARMAVERMEKKFLAALDSKKVGPNV